MVRSWPLVFPAWRSDPLAPSAGLVAMRAMPLEEPGEPGRGSGWGLAPLPLPLVFWRERLGSEREKRLWA